MPWKEGPLFVAGTLKDCPQWGWWGETGQAIGVDTGRLESSSVIEGCPSRERGGLVGLTK